VHKYVSVTNCLHYMLFCNCADIEDVTFKTGNFKKFPVFVDMLVSAVAQVTALLRNIGI